MKQITNLFKHIWDGMVVLAMKIILIVMIGLAASVLCIVILFVTRKTYLKLICKLTEIVKDLESPSTYL